MLELQDGFSKYCCSLCIWDNWAIEQHSLVKDWPVRDNYVAGKSSGTSSFIVYKTQNLMKNCVKALDKNSHGLNY